MADDLKTALFQMRVDPAWLRKIDDWRRTQPDVPPRSVAVRRIVDQAIGPTIPVPSPLASDKSDPDKAGGDQ